MNPFTSCFAQPPPGLCSSVTDLVLLDPPLLGRQVLVINTRPWWIWMDDGSFDGRVTTIKSHCVATGNCCWDQPFPVSSGVFPCFQRRLISWGITIISIEKNTEFEMIGFLSWTIRINQLVPLFCQKTGLWLLVGLCGEAGCLVNSWVWLV